MTDRTYELHKVHSDAKDKFDHFVLAIIIAVVAFLVKDLNFKPLGSNPETIYLLSLVVFSFSAFFGFKRIEYSLEIYRLNYRLLLYSETEKPEKAKQVENLIQTSIQTTLNLSKYRNLLFGMGVFCFFSGRLMSAYVGT